MSFKRHLRITQHKNLTFFRFFRTLDDWQLAVSHISVSKKGIVFAKILPEGLSKHKLRIAIHSKVLKN